MNKQRWFFVPASLFILICGVLALVLPYGNEILFFNEYRSEPLNSIFRFFSWCGESWVWVVAVIATYFIRPYLTPLIALTGLIIIPFAYLVKDQVGTDRPITYFRNMGQLEEVVTVSEVRLNSGQTSFPSGHTLSAFGLSSLLVLSMGHHWKKRSFALALLAMMIGFSRIFLVQHFLVDVVGGATLGLIISALAWWAWNALRRKRL
ncbi:MAG: phosphatase PAP2 family protein [Saprospiraceae bacterium]|nr:phosphatase PAP2 family protein [Saprospiraceae bacterium]